jgi:glycine/D-amino acid oxidase-like deaminating enzyme
VVRRENLQALRTETFDLLVVGGGITGAGVARDAAMRGLRVALVERDDFASGTSSRSSRLVHGGLRYLEHGNLGLVLDTVGLGVPARQLRYDENSVLGYDRLDNVGVVRNDGTLSEHYERGLMEHLDQRDGPFDVLWL